MACVGLLLRVAGIGLGAGLIVFGLPLLVTPLPVGAIMIVTGIVLLVASSTHARDWVRRRRSRHPQFDERLTRMEQATPWGLRGILASTRPRAE